MDVRPTIRNERAGARRAALAAALWVAASGCGGLDIHINSPGDDAEVSDSAVTVTGTTAGPVRFVTVNGGTVQTTDGFRTWTADVRLVSGFNTITATAYGAAGNTTPARITVKRVDPFSATGMGMAFSAIRGSTRVPEPASGYPITIQGTLAEWTVTGPSWVHFSRSDGNGPGQVTVTAQATGLNAGTFTGEVTVTDGPTQQSRSFPVSLAVRSASLVVTPASLSFLIDASTPASGFSKALAISDELGGKQPSESVAWTVQSINVPWLRVSPSSGGTSPATQATATVDLPALAYAPTGTSTATITLAWRNAQGADQTIVLPITLDLRLVPPYVDFAAPYVGVENRPGSLVLRGRRFNAFGPTVTAFVGTTELPGQTTQGDTQLTITYPALAAGRYQVGIKGASGFLRTNAELVVLPSPSFAYAAIPVTTSRGRIIWDAERQVLYGINSTNQVIERYRFSAGAWGTDPYFVLPQCQDADLAPDGRSLIVLSSQAVHDIDLGNASWSAVLHATNPYSTCTTYLAQLAVANDGGVFIITRQWSAFCDEYTPSYLYNALDHSLKANPYPSGWFIRGGTGGSWDGTRIYAGNSSFDPAPGLAVFDTLAGTLTPNGPDYYPSGISISANASRVIVENNWVLNRTLANTGNLGSAGGTALASRDSSRAFVYRDGGQPRLVIYDLNGSLQIGAVYPVLRTISLPDAASTNSSTYVSMTSTHDDSVVFISGNSKLLVVPVN
jgi:hypothetical protein